MHDQPAAQRGGPTAAPQPPAGRAGPPAAGLLPGLAAAGAAVAVALLVNRVVPSVSPLMIAVLLGAAVANLGWLPEPTAPGLRLVQRRVLRVGVALLGFQLSVQEAARLGGSSLLTVLAAVTVTFLATLWLGRRLRLPAGLSLLTAAGSAICGAAAIAAVQGVSDAEEEDAAYALALVTLYGAAAMLLLPLLRLPLGLDAGTFGLWAGASVHEVAQVIATAAGGGEGALGPAVVTKLTRVLLLAPVVVIVAAVTRSRAGRSGAGRSGAGSAGAYGSPVAESTADGSRAVSAPADGSGASGSTAAGSPAVESPAAESPVGRPRGRGARAGRGAGGSARPPLLPLFVAAFLAAVVVRSLGVLPAGWLAGLKVAATVLLTAALFALGSAVRIRRLRACGPRPLVLGLAASILISLVAYTGIRLFA